MSTAVGEPVSAARNVGRDRREAWLQVVAYVVLFVPLFGALAVSFIVTPEDIETGRVILSPECTMRRLFGHGCPTCGLTRAFSALSHGRFADALGYHVASPVLYALWWVGSLFATVGLGRAVRDAFRWEQRLRGSRE